MLDELNRGSTRPDMAGTVEINLFVGSSVTKKKIMIPGSSENIAIMSNFGVYSLQPDPTLSNIPDMILLAITILQGIGINAIYDVCKYIFSILFDTYEYRAHSKKTIVKIECGDTSCTLNFSFRLSRKQKNMIVDAALRKVINASQIQK